MYDAAVALLKLWREYKLVVLKITKGNIRHAN